MPTSLTTCLPPSFERNNDAMEVFLVNSVENYLKELMFTIANIVLEESQSVQIGKEEERYDTYWEKKTAYLTLII